MAWMEMDYSKHSYAFLFEDKMAAGAVWARYEFWRFDLLLISQTFKGRWDMNVINRLLCLSSFPRAR